MSRKTTNRLPKHLSSILFSLYRSTSTDLSQDSNKLQSHHLRQLIRNHSSTTPKKRSSRTLTLQPTQAIRPSLNPECLARKPPQTLQTELTQLHASLLSPTPACSRALVQLAQQTPTRLTLPAWHALQLEIASWYLSLVLESTDSSDKEHRVPSEEATRRLTTHTRCLNLNPSLSLRLIPLLP